jgi:RimJ/RimL family protein N-acetyltransferase
VIYSELDEEQKDYVFSRMAEMIDDFFMGADHIPEKEDIDDMLSELCAEMSDIALVQDDSMRSAFNEIIEQIIAECKENGIEIPTFLETLTVTGTERLALRRFCRNDTESLFDLMKNPEAIRNFENVFVKKKEARKWLNRQLTCYHKDGYGYFAVMLKDTGKLIGQTGIIQAESGGGVKSAEIGYIFDNAAFEQGYAFEAVKAFADWAFERYNFERLYCKIRSENETAAILAGQLGMLKTEECAVTEQADGSCDIYVLERKIN